MLQKIARLSLVALALAGLLPAQSSFTAAVRGVISDATGAAVPGARVIITEADRNVQHASVTDEAGRYVITALQPGNYRMVVEAQGFKKCSCKSGCKSGKCVCRKNGILCNSSCCADATNLWQHAAISNMLHHHALFLLCSYLFSSYMDYFLFLNH